VREIHGFPKENAICPPCGGTQAGVTGGVGAEDERGTHGVAGAGLATEFLPAATSGFYRVPATGWRWVWRGRDVCAVPLWVVSLLAVTRG